MRKSSRLSAEEQFTATQKKTNLALEEKEKGRREMAEKVARLRALRLAKELADKEAAEVAAAEKATTKSKKSSRSTEAQ